LLDLALIAAGGFLGAMVVGSAGFAFAIVVTGVWIYVLAPAQIVLLAAVCATILHIVSIWQFRREIEFSLLWPFLVGGAMGVPLGVVALQRLDTHLFRHIFGGLMIAYSAYMLMRPSFAVLRMRDGAARVADGFVGWVSGILGGFALLHGTLPLVMLCVGVTIDIDKRELLLPIVVGLPAMGLGLWAGLRVFEVISEQNFRLVVLWLILVSGISLQF